MYFFLIFCCNAILSSIRPPVKNDEAGRSTDYDLSSQEISQRPPRYIEVQHGNIFLSSHPQISPTEKVPEGDLDKVRCMLENVQIW